MTEEFTSGSVDLCHNFTVEVRKSLCLSSLVNGVAERDQLRRSAINVPCLFYYYYLLLLFLLLLLLLLLLLFCYNEHELLL